jgi:hypothetical protein
VAVRDTVMATALRGRIVPADDRIAINDMRRFLNDVASLTGCGKRPFRPQCGVVNVVPFTLSLAYCRTFSAAG